MIHSHSKAWVRLLGLGLALGLLCGLLPAYAFAEEAPAGEAAAVQSVEPEAGQAAAETPEAETEQGSETGPAQTPAEQSEGENAPGNEPEVQRVRPYSGDAAIYYLADPAGDPWTNDTGEWAPANDTSSTIARINTTGAVWQDGYVGGMTYREKNIKSNVASYITAWPDGSTGSVWTVRRDDSKTGSYFNAILDSIWASYRASVEQITGRDDLTRADVSEITLTPRKISRDNGGNYDYHIDCALSIQCTKMFTARFWVLKPGTDEYEMCSAKNYPTGSAVQNTASVEQTVTVDGQLYTLDGWYVENDAGNAPSGDKASFPHTPTETQLADGAVNYYAHYIPATVDLTVTKRVTGAMGDKNRRFTFQWSCGEREGSFTLSDGESAVIEDVAVGGELTLTETDSSGYAVSVSYGGENYSVDAQGSVQLTAAWDGGTIIVTNHKDVIPDTGLTLVSAPYAAALGLTAVSAAVLLYRRSKRRG